MVYKHVVQGGFLATVFLKAPHPHIGAIPCNAYRGYIIPSRKPRESCLLGDLSMLRLQCVGSTAYQGKTYPQTLTPTFTCTEDPLDADHLLWMIEQKLGLLRCETTRRLYLPPINFRVLLVHGGPTIWPCTLPTTLCLGLSFVEPFTTIMSPRE